MGYLSLSVDYKAEDIKSFHGIHNITVCFWGDQYMSCYLYCYPKKSLFNIALPTFGTQTLGPTLSSLIQLMDVH